MIESNNSKKYIPDSNEQFRLLADNSPLGILKMDRQLKFTYVNNTILQWTGKEMSEVIGSYSNVFSDQAYLEDIPRIFEKTYQALVENRHVGLTYQIKAFDGEFRWMEQLVYPWYSNDGTIGGIDIIVSDISELKKCIAESELVKDQLAQAQKMSTIGEIATGMIHDFNNILLIISGNAQFGIKKFNNDKEVGEIFNEIVAASERAQDITNRLLSMSRQKTAQNMISVSVNSLIEELVKLLGRSFNKNINIETKLDNNMPLLIIDPNQIFHALINICINSRDAMKSGGTILIETEMSDKSATSSNLPEGQYYTITISDTGSGISKEIISRIRDPFFTTKDKENGTGLGLYITYQLIEDNKGHIEISSEPGKGTKTIIYFPDVVDSINKTKDSVESPESNRVETVLVIDDDRRVLDIIERALIKDGYKTIISDSSTNGVSIFENNAENIDLVILDIVMPEMDGREVFFKIKKVKPDIKVVVCSGFSSDGVAEDMMDGGANAFIQKPFKINKLCEVVYKVIHS